jgi:hypothetical protein
MFWLILKSYWALLQVEHFLARGAFSDLCDMVRSYSVRQRVIRPDTVGRVCSALNLACICYCKEVLCLQRAAATTRLLRSYGVSAEMVIGAQDQPFRAHAWVEVDGCVVNDRLYVPEIYKPLERC